MSEEPQRKKLKSSSDDDNKEEQCSKLTFEKLLEKIEEQKSKIEEQNNKIEEQTTIIAERDTKIEEQATIIVERDTKIEEQATIIVERDTKIAKLNKKTLGYFLTEGLKELVDSTASSPHLQTGHTDSKIVIEEIEDWPNLIPDRENPSDVCLDLPSSANNPSDVCLDLPSSANNVISSEGDVVHNVAVLIRSVMISLGLENYLHLHQNVHIFGLEVDIVVCYEHNMMPIGSFEVKKPKVNLTCIDKFKQVYGQVFNQMHTFRLGGPEEVFSVLTNFNEWQLHSTDEFDKEKITRKVKKLLQDLNDENPRSPASSSSNQKKDSPEAPFIFKKYDNVDYEWENEGSNKNVKKRAKKVRKIEGIIKHEHKDVSARTNYASEVVGINSGSTSEIVNLIATALVLMLNSAKNMSKMPRIVNKPLKGPTRILELGKGTFAFSEKLLKDGIDFDKKPDIANTTKFRLWMPVGFGETGTCCLATDEDGNWCCVIKFYSVIFGSKKLANDEVSHWVKLYGERVAKVGTVPGQEKKWLAVIPYIHPIPKADRSHLVEQGLEGILGAALLGMAKKGIFYKDEDVCWRHIGYTTSKKLEIRLCDLANLEKIDPSKETYLVKEALKRLQFRNQEQYQSKTSPNHLREGK